MKILKDFALVVVFVVLTLAVAAGCSVDVLPEGDGGGTASGDDVPDDDGLTGADGNGVGGGDGSTTVDDVDDVDPTRDGGGNPDDVDDDVDPDDYVGEDGGMTENGDGGSPMETELDPCDPNEFSSPGLGVALDLWSENCLFGDVGIGLGPAMLSVGSEPPPNCQIAQFRYPLPEEHRSPIPSNPLRVVNRSSEKLIVLSVAIFGSEEDTFNYENPLWIHEGDYPDIESGQYLDVGLPEEGGSEYFYTPFCRVQPKNIGE